MPSIGQFRCERGELYGIVTVLTASMLISLELYTSMVDGWQEHIQTRTHVLVLASSLLALSIVACLYLCYRLKPTLPLNTLDPGTLTSVNSQLLLVGSEQPPSYDAVVICPNQQPPAYNTVSTI